MARPGRPERNRRARSFRQLRRFHHVINSDKVFGTHTDVILANTTPAVAALRHETAALPIVFVQVTDPLGQGFVANLAHPASNVTGFSFVDFTVGEKWLQGLKEIAPPV